MSVAKPMNKRYVAGKVKSLKWKPTDDQYESSKVFAAGTWDDEDSNCISIWELRESGKDPVLIQEKLTHHDVNSIEYISDSCFVVGLSNGNVQLWTHSSEDSIELSHEWKKSHFLKAGKMAACTRLASHEDQVASVGEDGRLVIYDALAKKTLQTIESGGGCSEYGLTYVKVSEVLTGGLQGHLRLWDLRTPRIAKATLMSPDYVSVTHLCSHPTQQHIVAAGGEDGVLAIWDMRSTAQPFTLISAHTGPISETQFHPSHSNSLFTCGMDGKVLQWSVQSQKSSLFPDSTKVDSISNTWLSPNLANGDVEAVSLLPSSILPTNTLNIESKTLLVGSDNAAVYIIDNMLN